MMEDSKMRGMMILIVLALGAGTVMSQTPMDRVNMASAVDGMLQSSEYAEASCYTEGYYADILVFQGERFEEEAVVHRFLNGLELDGIILLYDHYLFKRVIFVSERYNADYMRDELIQYYIINRSN